MRRLLFFISLIFVGACSDRVTDFYRLSSTMSCDPFSGQIDGCAGGLSGEVYYLNAEQRGRFRKLSHPTTEFFFTDGLRLNAVINFQNLFVSSRKFSDGFRHKNGEIIRDDQGNPLVEYFAFHLRALLRLDRKNKPGTYEFALISDDGAILRLKPNKQDTFETIVDNDGTHRPRLGCSTTTIEMTTDSNIPLELEYYQGPGDKVALTLLWRRIDGPAGHDPLCGQKEGEGWYFFGPPPHQDFSNAWGYGQLVERGWKVLSERNFVSVQ
jgi:hypothetical protein